MRMNSVLLRGAVCWMVLALSGCRAEPPLLAQEYSCKGSYEACSSLIVVATVTHLRATGRTADLSADNHIVVGGGRTWLFEVKAGVEDVLKGSVSRGDIIFYFYGSPLDEATIGSQVFLPKIGQRYVLKLRDEAGTLRTVVDWAEWPHDQVYSGYHSPSFLDPRWTVEESIARILLVPGNEFERLTYAGKMDRAASLAEGLVGPLKAMQILQSLLERPECEIRTAACIVLAQYYPGHDDCLPAAARDHCLIGATSSVTLGLDIPGWLARADERARRLVSKISDSEVPSRDGPPEYRRQFLEILASHPDKRVAIAARAALDHVQRRLH